MNLAAIFHRPTLEYIYPESRNELTIQLCTAKDDVNSVVLVWWYRNENSVNNLHYVLMNKVLSDEYSDYYRITINTASIAAYVRYYFVVKDDEKTLSFAINGFIENEPEFNDNYFEFLWPNKSDGYNYPKWSNNLIYYQIFPERFRNGNTNLTPNNSMAWGSTPTRDNFMGGDLQGIIDSLDYLCDLGINCIYLTPIFNAPSNHKYDTIDYYEINPSFGSKDDLRNLVKEAHKRNIKILLDGVFNHSGYYWSPFQDVVLNNEKSIYADWFYIHDFPVSLDKQNYDCVGHYKWMPKINLENPKVANYFIKVGEYWLKEFNIDGWRLDVADEVPISFWQKFSSHLKALKPDVVLLGETWSDADKLINSCRLDSAMNYLFHDAVVAWLGTRKISSKKFDSLINRMLSYYPYKTALRLYNPLDSHDTSRFINECNFDFNYYRLAIALQMTLPGCPAIFYGDEIGLSGNVDPDCRACMKWDKEIQNKEIYAWYKKLIEIRKNNEALSEGDYKTLASDDKFNVFIFSRKTKNEEIKVIVNAGDSIFKFNLPINEYLCLLDDGYITENDYIKVPAFSVHIFKKEEVKDEE